jgi:DNA-binding response OmpR family regulator
MEQCAMPTFRLATVSQRSTLELELPLRGRTILIVEDEPLIALDLHAALRAAGADLIAATSSAEALTLIRRNDMAAAIVDVNLANDDCFSVCQALFHRSVPFLFYTGHREAKVLTAWPDVPVLPKPTHHNEIIARVGQLVR